MRCVRWNVFFMRRSGRVAPLAVLTVLAAGCPPPASRPAASQPATRPAEPRVVDYAPGVRIDFRGPQVEVEAQVCLREGPLELFAYSRAPIQKDHETVLIMQARPLHIFEALGLIGLWPGRPVEYDPDPKTVRLPRGDPVDVLVRYQKDGRPIEVSACDWMYDVDRAAPMRRMHWLFCGSKHMEDGTFYADYEGTVVTVVDFPGSLLGLPTSHSDSDSALWLAANTEALPPVKTKVTLILRPLPTTRTITLEGDGRTLLEGVPIADETALTAALKEQTLGWASRATVVIRGVRKVTNVKAELVRKAVESAGIDAERIRIE